MRETEPIDGPIHSHKRYRMHVADDSVILNRLVGHRPSPLPGSFKESVSRGERGCAKVDAKASAPDRDSPVLPKIYRVGHVIVLITDIALETTEIDESIVFYCCVVLSVGCRDQIDVNVRAVRGSEIC